MATWLTRSLLFIVAGAVLAYAVTAHVEHIDLQTTGIILLLVGIFDLLLNVALTMYYQRSSQHYREAYRDRAVRRPTDDDRYATREIHPRDPDWH